MRSAPLPSGVVVDVAACTRRRWLFSGLLAGGVFLSGCAASPGVLAQQGYTISQAQIQGAVARKFPRSYGMGGLVNLALADPRIRLKPEHDQLNAVIAVVASGPLLQGRSYNGALDVDFSLRYEASDRTLRATRLQLNGLRMEGLTPAAEQMLQQYGTTLAQRSLQEVVLHQLSEQDLALTDGLGLEPGQFTVTDKGLVVQLKPKNAL
ncbi:DUF1439 domain-containing protein [Diaphorobacter ruginosibacter]|uniref:DUF1439 domain-containing protein n=1 Tax=Diaphorobacter ruginosibacter TaxID=1715720 RepID=UPI001FE30776|nr:DUF1439 domain-containing protein [Diaphorobacter ruginosibacter]